ncbi:hypothetical protein B9Z55_005020 [Caenorhabditis nigoni]|uniref:Integrase catalytic domain-containing protein n=1 Tax=Caenorhabditis nigoni TaxID=1611254 RepID=A0A2G5UZ10_9PELO|nr:hypothetical protein B9Z55_005020 [Caenorhabditis nigoni]
MSLTTARKNLTRGVNTVKTTIEDVEPHLVKWQKATADEIGNFEEECQSWFRILFKQLERMKTFSKELNEEADKLVDPTDDELKKEEEYVQKYVDALDLGSNTLDRIEEQCERCNGESPRGKALEQSLQIRRLELFEPSEYGSIRNGSNRNMSREHLPDNGVEAIGTQQTMVMMPQQHVILDRPRLPKFDGKPWEFENFWTMFQEFVGNTNKSNLRKMNELINSLEGEPKELLKKFRLSNETYQPAVELLHKKYNDGEKIIAVLTGRLAEEKATSGQISEQRRVLDQINIIVDQLCEFKENVDNRMMKNEILKKFSNTIRKEVLMLKLDVPPDEWTTAKLLEILEFTISRQEELQEAMKETNPTHPEKSNKDQNTRDSQHKAGDKKRFNPDQKKGPFCTYCKQKGHFSDRCNEVTKIEDRKKILVNESRCLQCLQKGHQTNACENRPCYTCERKGHHSSLCFSKKKNESTEKKQSEDKSKQKPKTTAVANIELKEEEDGDEGSKESSVATTVATRGYIPTLRTSAQNPSNGEWEAISTMLDSGADQTYIRRDLAEKWKLPNEGTETFNLRTFGSQESKSITFEKTTILIKAGKKTLDMKALVSENLAGRVWKARLTKDDMEHMIKKKMDINEDVFEDVVEPQLIIGCDYLSDLMIGNMITLPSGVKLIKTHMGYTTMGPEKIKKQDKDESGNGKESHHLMAYDEDPTAEVQRDIEEKQKFDMQMKTEQEFTGPMADEIAEIDKKVMEFFEDTIVKKEDGYEVRYPFKQSWTEIPDNLPIAIKRLQSVVRTQPREVLQMVQKVFDDQEEQGIIERVDPDEHTTNLVRYNPTHPVLTPNKTTTKCRVVVDGSSHGRGDQSINELLHKGPILMPDMVEMLIRFRSGTTAIISDVEKAFLQVRVNPLDRDITRVIWLKDIDAPVTRSNIQVYRFTRVIFGLNVSPFLLGATILHHLKQHEDRGLAEEVAKNLYVDNLIITSDEDTDEMIQTYKKVKNMFDGMNMNLREFLSNSVQFNNLVEEKDKASETITKVLGICWNSETDTLMLRTGTEEQDKFSRRTVSSRIASTYDPMGFIGPLLLPLKLFQRQLWNDFYQWDTPMIEEHQKQWEQLLNDFNGFEREVPRRAISKSGTNTVVTFCDASKDATAFCCYIVSGKEAQLLCSKSKVKPLKEVWTIPKLETQAMKMGCERTATVLNAILEGKIQVDQVIILTDSTIALSWIKTKPGKKETGVFITNRLNAIIEAVKKMEEKNTPVFFGHVKTNENPADIGTRGSTNQEFNETDWFTGGVVLQELREDPEKWKREHNVFKLDHDDTLIVNTINTKDEEHTPVFNNKATNRLATMVRIAGYVVRFINRCASKFSEERRKTMLSYVRRSEEVETRVSPKEADKGRELLIKDHQKSFTTKQLKKLQNLGLVKNSKGFIVCRGRMSNLEGNEETREPILVLPNSQLCQQIIRQAHGRFHSSVEHTMEKVRQKFWIPKLRQQVKSIMAKCVECQRFNKSPCRYPDMAQLPKARFKMEKPFGTAGVDCFGPISYIKEDGTEGSAYGTLYTCVTTRLVHLEVSPDYTAFNFLQTMRRFIAIRGCPDRMLSDNGTNFLLGKKIVEEAIKANNMDTTNIQSLEWVTITPYSPWKGGIWERMVKTVKHAFLKSIKQRKLTMPELETVMYEVMAEINSRPLTRVEDGINCNHPIRPCDFVSPQMKIELPLETVLEQTENFRPSKEQQEVQTKMDTIRALKASVKASEKTKEIWRTKYMAELRETHKKRMDQKRGSPVLPKIGQTVLVSDDLLRRKDWPTGRITELVKSSDGEVREVLVEMQSGKGFRTAIHRRSINHIVPLELDNESETEETVMEEPTVPEVEEEPQEEPKRYNLRKRKEVNYEDDDDVHNTLAHNSIFGVLGNSIIFTIAMVMMMIVGVHSEAAEVNCNYQGLQIKGDYKSFEACSEDFCTSNTRFAWNFNNEKKDIWLPPAIKIRPHHCSVKISDGKQITVKEITCPAIPFCQTIDCTFCMTNLLNPECHLPFAIIGLGAVVFLLLMCLHIICNVPITLGAPVAMGWRITWMILGQLYQRCRRFIRPRQRNRWLGGMVIIFWLMQSIQCCQNIDIVEQKQKICRDEGTETHCEMFTEEMIVLNQAQREGCLRLSKNSTVLWEYKFKLEDVTMKCIKETVVFTKPITTKVWSVKRCPRMGSCKDEKCSKVFKDTLLPELEQVNNFTGNTGCSESCGGAGCDCFYLSSGCLFYRIYAVPKSEESHEIYKCTEYEPIAHLAVTVTRLNGWKNRAKTVIMGLKIGQTSEIWNNTITLDNVWTPPSPILNNWFIRNDKATALWPIGKWPQLRCNEKLQNCVLKEDCQCQPAQEEMRCACEDNDWDTLFTDVKAHLPIQEGHWKMENEKESVIARMKISAEAKIVVKLREEWDTVTYVSNDQCVAETTPATGCYNCASGVTVEFDCKSLQRDTIANVNCETEQFTIPCSTTGEKSTMTFFADKAKFRRICRIDCGGKKVQNIEITGVLKFSGSIWTSVYRMLQGNTTVFNEINIPDVGHLLDSYLSYMKTVILVLMVVGIVFLFTYSAITNAGTAIISTMLKIMSTLMWIAIRICIRVIQLPLNVVQNLRRRRRHAHLHTLVFFILFTPLIVACGKSQTMFTDSTSELENSSILSSSFHLSSHRSNSSLHLCDYNSYRSHRPLDVSTPMYPSDTYQFQIAEIMVKNVLEKLQEKMEEVQEELKRTNPDIWETTNRKIDKIQSSLDMLNQKLDHILEDMDQLVAGGAPPASQGDQEDFGIQIQLEEDMEIDHEETVEIPEDRRRRSSGQLRVDEVIDEDAEEDIDKGDEEELQEDDDDEMDEEVEENPPRVKSTVMVPPPRSLKIQRSENAGQVSRLTRNIYIKPVNRMKRRCIYCRGQHFSDNCPKVEEPKERRTFLKENRFCDKCLKAIEREHRCRPEEIKACFYCGVDTHHTSICEVPRHQHLNQPPRSVKKKEAARKYFEKLQNRRH